MASNEDSALSLAKAAHYRGIAKISLDALNFDHPLVVQKHRQVSQKNVERLRRVFRQHGCERLQQENFVSAIIDEDALEVALRNIGTSPSELLQFREGDVLPTLNLQSVDCLSGLHRIEAARAFLDDNDQWWVVRLFAKETPPDVLSRITEAFGNEQRPSDGEIFRKIRYYHRTGDEESENRWWACLECSKPKDLRQLIKNTKLIAAFDALIDMPGLWSKVQLGALHRLLALRCDEEMIQYLVHIKRIWMHILRHNDGYFPFSLVDPVTAAKLELLAPWTSEIDRKSVADMMARNELFPSVVDQNARSKLLQNICEVECLIPTLWTFFENLKYLEPCCDAIKQILGDKLRGTLRRSLMGCYFAPEKVLIQSSEESKVEFTGQITQGEAAQLAYVQIWASCARNCDSLTMFTPRKEIGKTKPRKKEPNPLLLQNLAELVTSLGFKIPRAIELATRDSQSQLALEYLQKVNPSQQTFSSSQIQGVVSAAAQSSKHTSIQCIEPAKHMTLDRRCGRPFEDDYLTDKASLFFPTIYGETAYSDVTLGFVRNDLFTQFFGPFQLRNEDLGPIVAPYSDDSDMPDAVLNNGDLNARMAEAELQHQNALQHLKDQTESELQRRHLVHRDELTKMKEDADSQIQKLMKELRERDERIKKFNEKSILDGAKRLMQTKATITRRRSDPRRTSVRKKLGAPKKPALLIEPPPQEPTSRPMIEPPPQDQLMIEPPPQERLMIEPPPPLIVTDEIRRNILQNKGEDDFFTAAIPHYGQPSDYRVLNPVNPDISHELVFFYGKDQKGQLRAVRLEISKDDALAIEQTSMVIQELETYEKKTQLQFRIGAPCPGSVRRVNKNKDDIFSACQAGGSCYVGTEDTLAEVTDYILSITNSSQ